MPTFVTVSHTAPPDGSWSLDDLPGTGRIDVVCRNVQAALFTSHGIRDDTVFIAVLHADPTRPVAIRINGAAVQHLNPDERSTAARLQQAVRGCPDDPWWDPVAAGIDVAPFDLAAVLADIGGTPILLHKDGASVVDADLPDDAVFVMGDHLPLTDPEEKMVGATQRVSLGDSWLHGNHIIAIVHWMRDQRA